MKLQSQSVPNLNQNSESEVAEEAEGEKDAETEHKKEKKYKRLSKSFWNLFSPSSASKERRSESSVTAEKFVALTEEGEEEEKEEEKVDAALKDSLEDVKKVRHILCIWKFLPKTTTITVSFMQIYTRLPVKVKVFTAVMVNHP